MVVPICKMYDLGALGWHSIRQCENVRLDRVLNDDIWNVLKVEGLMGCLCLSIECQSGATLKYNY